MKTVTLTSVVVYREIPRKAGEPFEVDDETAAEYEKRGIVHKGRGPTEQVLAQRQILRQESIQRTGSAGAEFDDTDDIPTPPPEKEFVFLPVSTSQYAALQSAGYASPEDLRGVSVEELASIPGIDREVAQRIIDSINGASEGSMEEEEEAPSKPTQTQQTARLATSRRR